MTPDDVMQKIKEIVEEVFPDSGAEEICRMSPDKLEKNLIKELNLDSLDVLLLEVHLEKEFGIPFGYEEIKLSLGNIVEYICSRTRI